jgi:hypothetical protein
VQGTELKDVERFTYLESTVSMTGGMLEDVESRIRKVKAAFAGLNTIWESRIYKKETKLRHYNVIVKLTLLFGSECWTMTRKIESKLNVFHYKCLRRILQVFYPNLVTNNEILRRTGQENIVVELTDRKWRWIGQMARRGTDNITRQSFLWRLSGKRKCGRPQETWRVADRECKVAVGKNFSKAVEEDAEQREEWHRMVITVRTEVAHRI